jgi:uncharacterized protein YcbX
MAHVSTLRIYPVKGLDGMAVDEVTVRDGGTLAHDREFALFDTDGEVINGRRTDQVHRVQTDFDRSTRELAVETPAGESHRFDLGSDREQAEEWFSGFLGVPVSLERDPSLGYVDRRAMGPSVISTATLETVASWFDGMTVEGARRRLRANVEVGGVPAFWEDRLVGEVAPSFRAGGVRFDGVTPCGRCVVPERDPETGKAHPGFRERFVEKRRETFPDWADPEAFDHYYTLMVITRVPDGDRGRSLAVGDGIELLSE